MKACVDMYVYMPRSPNYRLQELGLGGSCCGEIPKIDRGRPTLTLKPKPLWISKKEPTSRMHVRLPEAQKELSADQ